MNDDIEVMGRLVDYHNHISAPPVPLTDDLHRGRRRVRRNRGVLAAGAGLSVVAVLTGVMLFSGQDPADRQQPVGPSTPDATVEPSPDTPGSDDPMEAPASLLDVRELGFRVGPVRGFDVRGWVVDIEGHHVTLGWEEADDADVYVAVLYRGGTYPHPGYGLPLEEAVTINGVPGRYYSEPEDPSGGPGGAFGAELVWEYGDSWAYVRTMSEHGDPGPARLRAALIEVAETVSPGGLAVRLPVRLGTLPPSLPPLATLRSVGVHRDSGGWTAALTTNFGDTQLLVGPGTGTVTCVPGYRGGGAETFTHQGHQGCLSGWGPADGPRTTSDVVSQVKLQIGETVRSFTPGHAEGATPYPIADVKQLLTDLAVAPLDDPSTWFDLKTAFGG